MPVATRKIRGLLRTVKEGTQRVEKTPKGNPRDGGGWPDTPEGRRRAGKQVGIINESLEKRERRRGKIS